MDQGNKSKSFFVHHLSDAKNMFDIIAIAYHEIQNEMYAIKLDDYSTKHVRDIDKIIQNYSESEANARLRLQKLKSDLEYLYSNRKFSFIDFYEMIIQLDLTLIDDEFYFNSITPVHKYTALNYNFKTTKVYILSKCKQTILDYCNHELNKKTGHEFRDRRVLKNEILDLNNLIILCENDLKGYEINISNIKINET